MICYKDRTYCDDWCNTIECSRNYSKIDWKHVEQVGLPVSFFVAVPMGCSEYTPKEKKES